MMIRSEAEAQGFITRIFRDPLELKRLGLWGYGGCGVEVKATVCKRKDCGAGMCKSGLGFSKIEAGQWQALKRTRGEGIPLAYKISDSGIGYKPYDMVALWGLPGLFIFVWACSGVSKYFVMDSVDCEAFKEATGVRGSFSAEWCASKAMGTGELG